MDKMEEKETIERKQMLLKALAVSWAVRALGKMSHAGFNACMSHVKEIVPSEVWGKVNGATMHYHDPLKEWVVEMKKALPEDVVALIGGDMPSIDRLQKMADEFEEWE